MVSKHPNVVVRVLHFEEEVKRNLEYFVHFHHHFHLLPQVFKVSCLTLLSLACISATNAEGMNQANFDTTSVTISDCVKTSGSTALITDFHDYGDGASGTTWLYLNDQAQKNDQGLYELVINVSSKYPIPDPDNKNISQKYRFYIGGSFRTGTSVKEGFGEKIQTNANNVQSYEYNGKEYFLQGIKDDPNTNFSKGVEGYSVVLNMKENSSLSTKIYGGRNDLFGADSAGTGLIGQSNNNKVEINFEKNSLLFSQIVFGGRAAQMEGIKATEGFATNNNSVVLTGYSLRGKDALKKDPSDGFADMVIRAGIWGAEGYETDNNIVTIKDATIVAQSTTFLQWGITGGRGYFHERLNADTKDKTQSAISKNNVVIITNSSIGFNDKYKSYGDPNGDGNLTSSDQEGKKSINVFGGYSLGIASENLVVLDNSKINGEVFGGFELQNKVKGTTDDIRNLNANLVSLHNVSIAEGYSFYGSGTADLYNGNSPTISGNPYYHTNKESGYEWLEDGQYAIEQNHLLPVNRRRGIAYLAGKVESDSAYVRYIHFGEYYDPNSSVLTDSSQRKEIRVSKNYYPNVTGQTSANGDESGIIRITDSNNDNGEGIAIGQLVGGSYLLNRKGFHSDLSPEKDSGGKFIQSDTTIGLHNFWVGTYVNLLGTVNGDGSSLNVKAQLFKDKKVNHSYNEDGGFLSLLALDDGLVLGGESSTPVMDRFRDEYTNETGRVLYLGVNDGQVDKAVNIDFGKIQDFRNNLTKQGTKAFGNTQVGLWVNGNGQDQEGNPFVNAPLENGDTSTEWNDMVIHVPDFDIRQGNTSVGKATFGFYKYLHFDGTYDDATKVKQTADGEEGGVGLKYWLESINILSGQNLVLKGKVGNSSFADGEDPTTYTLSAYLTGGGNVVIPSNNTVILGDSRVTAQQLATEISGENGTKQTKAGENTYTGTTTVATGAKLIQGSDGALGSTTSYTSELNLEASSGTQYHLLGHSQTVGKLSIGEKAEMHFSDVDSMLVSLITNGTTNDSAPKSGTTKVNGVEYEGYFHAKDGAEVQGELFGTDKSMLVLSGNGNSELGYSKIYSANAKFKGTVKLDNTSLGLENTDALQAATIDIGTGSSLYFNTVSKSVANSRYGATVGAINNSGTIYLSKAQTGNAVNNDVNHVYIERNYVGLPGSTLVYRGVISDDNSIIDKVRVNKEASGATDVKVLVAPTSRGKATDKGILIFSANQATDDQTLSLIGEPIVVAEENPSRVWEYTLEKRVEPEADNGIETDTNWYLVNEYKERPKPDEPVTPDDPVIPDGPILRPESGAYVAASQSWAKMHMRLHDRFGQAYYIDPFSGEEKPAATWVRQVGSHSHFRMNGGESKTHSRTAVTQIGGDLIRDEFNEDWKYIGGIFTGGLYNRSNSRSSNLGAKSRTDGYAFGIYGTVYTGNSPDDGFYVDSWLMYGHYNNKVWSDTWPAFKYKSNGWVWSVESGYTIPIGESGTKDYNKLIWTFQPEVQVVWDGLKADDAVDVTGTRYKQLGTNNVAIRVGARLHANYMNKGLGFIEGNWIHNTKKAGVEMSGSKVYMDGERNLGEFRMGMEGHITKNTLGWATVGAQFGKSGYHNETAQIGIKYMF